MSLLIKNAWIPDRGNVDMAIDQGIIESLNPAAIDFPATGGTEVLDAGGMAALPGLINGHSHAAMTLFRGYGDDMPLHAWLENRIWPAEARMSEQDVYWGVRLACLEMIRAGCVRFEDAYWHFHATARAVIDSGLRAGVGTPLIDIAGREQGDEFRRLAEKNFSESNRYDDRIRFTLTPHAPHTVSPSLLRWTAEFSHRHGLPIHIHLSETRQEVDICLKNHGLRPAFHLDRLGLLNERTLLAHGVHLDDAELDLIAERGATLVTNPVSNMKLAVGGVFPQAGVKARGIPFLLGTDGTASNNNLDLFENLKFLTLLQKHAQEDPTALPAREAWAVACGAGVPRFGQPVATLTRGQRADLILLRRDVVEMTPEHHFFSNLVYAGGGHLVDTVVVAGRILMRNRHIPGEKAVRLEAAARAKSLCAS